VDRVVELIGFDEVQSELNVGLLELIDMWDHSFGQLLAYREAHGDCLVPEGHPLRGWVDEQRQSYAKERLSAARVQRLQEAGFAWEVFPVWRLSKSMFEKVWYAVSWEEGVLLKELQRQAADGVVQLDGEELFRNLTEFYAGDEEWVNLLFWYPSLPSLPPVNSILWQWLSEYARHKYHLKSQPISPTLIARLEGLGMIWDEFEALATRAWLEKFDTVIRYFSAYEDLVHDALDIETELSELSEMKGHFGELAPGSITDVRFERATTNPTSLTEFDYTRQRRWDRIRDWLDEQREQPGVIRRKRCPRGEIYWRSPECPSWASHLRGKQLQQAVDDEARVLQAVNTEENVATRREILDSWREDWLDRADDGQEWRLEWRLDAINQLRQERKCANEMAQRTAKLKLKDLKLCQQLEKINAERTANLEKLEEIEAEEVKNRSRGGEGEHEGEVE